MGSLNTEETSTDKVFTSLYGTFTNESYAPIIISVTNITPPIGVEILDGNSTNTDWTKLTATDTAKYIALGFGLGDGWNSRTGGWYVTGSPLVLGELSGRSSGKAALMAKYGLAWAGEETFNYGVTYGIKAA